MNGFNIRRDQQHAWQRREGKRFAMAFLVGLIILYAIWYFTATRQMPARLAAIGGAIATFGVLAMTLPVLRVGVFQYIANTVWEHEFSQEKNDPAAIEANEQTRSNRATDQINQNVLGPYLVAIGTIVNGFSGLF